MNYICSQCGSVGTSTWYQNKTRVKCPVCQHKVFQSIEDDLNFICFMTAFFAGTGSFILWRGLDVDKWLSLGIMIISGMVVCSYVEHLL